MKVDIVSSTEDLNVVGVVQVAIRPRGMRPDIDPEDAIDLLYGRIYNRLQVGTGH